MRNVPKRGDLIFGERGRFRDSTVCHFDDPFRRRQPFVRTWFREKHASFRRLEFAGAMTPRDRELRLQALQD